MNLSFWLPNSLSDSYIERINSNRSRFIAILRNLYPNLPIICDTEMAKYWIEHTDPSLRHTTHFTTELSGIPHISADIDRRYRAGYIAADITLELRKIFFEPEKHSADTPEIEKAVFMFYFNHSHPEVTLSPVELAHDLNLSPIHTST